MRNFLHRCESVYVYSAVVSTFALMCLTGIDAAMRYIFNMPIMGAYEISEQYVLVVAVFFGVCYVYRGGAYVRVTFLVEHLPRQVKVVVNYFSQVITILLTFIMLIASIQQALRKISSGITLEAWSLPLWPAYVIVPLGLFPMILALLLDLPRIKTGESCLLKEEEHIT